MGRALQHPCATMTRYLVFALVFFRHAWGLRYWIDLYAFAPGETVLLTEAINATAGEDVLAGTSHGGFLAPKGWHDSSAWDVYWTAREGCYRAFSQRLNPGQMVSCTPGSHAITQKPQLVLTMGETYGDASGLFMPRSFLLPWDHLAFARAVKAGGPSRPWVLKEDVHRGRGVVVVPASEAVRASRELKPSTSQHNIAPRELRYVVAQEFVDHQLLIARRPFYLRLWVLSLGTHPLRSYLFDGGVVVFGSVQKVQSNAADQSSQDMVVNLWQQDREAAKPWSLGQLREHLDATRGQGTGARLWRRMQAATAAALAAALPHQRDRAAQLPGYQGGNVEVLGVDFLVDQHLAPHLVEVNWLPSMARKVIGQEGGEGEREQSKEPFDVQKELFLAGMLRVLRASHVAAEDGLAEGRRPRGLQAAHWLALRALRHEARAAQGSFADLTNDIYEALACTEIDLSESLLDSCTWIQEQREQVSADRDTAVEEVGPKLQERRTFWPAWMRLLPRLHWGAPRLLKDSDVQRRKFRSRLSTIERLTLELTRRTDSLILRGTEVGYEAAIEKEWTKLARERRIEL